MGRSFPCKSHNPAENIRGGERYDKKYVGREKFALELNEVRDEILGWSDLEIGT